LLQALNAGKYSAQVLVFDDAGLADMPELVKAPVGQFNGKRSLISTLRRTTRMG